MIYFICTLALSARKLDDNVKDKFSLKCIQFLPSICPKICSH